MLVDAHNHIFPRIDGLNASGLTRGLGYGRAMIGADEVQVTPPFGEGLAYTPETLLANMDWAGVDKAVLLPHIAPRTSLKRPLWEHAMLVDAHNHIFPRIDGLNASGLTRGLGYGRALIGNDEVQVTPPFGEGLAYTPETLLAHMDWAGVDRAVLLQGPFYGECNRYVQDALQRYPDRLVGAAYFDPWMADSRRTFEEILGKGELEAPFRAVKLECSVPTGLCGIHPQARLDAPDLAWLWPELERRGLILVLDMGGIGSRSYQTAAVRAIAEGHTRLKVVIAHLGQPNPSAEADIGLWQQWKEQIDLGLLPNVWFDCASLIAYVHEEGYPFASAERYLRLAIERIGARKVMWGSDQPGTLVHATYRQYVTLAKLHTRFLSPEDQALVLGENALQVYD